MDRLTPLDQLMVQASGRWPQEIGALALLDGASLLEPGGRFRIEAVREAIGSRLPRVPRFRQVIWTPRRGLGGPLWVDAPSFDLGDHVRVLALPAGGGEADLLVATERLRRQPLDPARPLWQMWFLPGLPDGQVGLFVRLHHAIADGMAAMATISSLLDTAPDAPAAPAPWTPAPLPSAPTLLADNLRRHLQRLIRGLSLLARPGATAQRLRAAWPAVRELVAEAPAAETSLDRMVGPDRTLALVRTTLELVRQAGHSYGATVNDVLLAVTAGGLRALLASRDEPVEDTTVRVYVPVSLRRPRARGPQQGNRIAQMAVPLALGEPDPGRRLQRIAAETGERKARTRTSLGTLFGGRVTRRLLLMAVMRQRVNVTTASIPGPEAPLHLGGARVLEVFPVLPLIANESLGVGALSYAGALTIGVVADQDAYPDLDIFTMAVRDDLAALGSPTPIAEEVSS